VKGVLPPSAYEFQAALGEGRRVDCLLKLPNPPGPIAVDAKFPLESYHALRNARDEAERVQAGRAFATAILKHVRDIAERYIVPGETAESALMFLPSEAVYAELHANFPDVVEKSYRAKVWIVSPTTLMATLNTVRAVLKDARMREQAGLIQKEVRLLLDDIVRLDDRVAALGKHFDQASEDIRQIRISTDKVTKRADRIEEVQMGEGETAIGLDTKAALPPGP
ncbi:MAG: DNA recombination protein RmuC, partial [Magnetospirillum sp.]